MPLLSLKDRPARIFVGCLIGGLFGYGLFRMVVFAGAGGHGPELPLTVAFPFAQFAHRLNPGGPSWVCYLLAFAQFPFYAFAFQLPPTKQVRLYAAVALVILHSLAVWACFLPDKFYERFW